MEAMKWGHIGCADLTTGLSTASRAGADERTVTMQRIGSPAPWMDALRALAQDKRSIRLLSATTTAHPADDSARDGRSCCARVLAVRSNGSVFVEQPPGGPMDWLALGQE